MAYICHITGNCRRLEGPHRLAVQDVGIHRRAPYGALRSAAWAAEESLGPGMSHLAARAA